MWAGLSMCGQRISHLLGLKDVAFSMVGRGSSLWLYNYSGPTIVDDYIATKEGSPAAIKRDITEYVYEN